MRKLLLAVLAFALAAQAAAGPKSDGPKPANGYIGKVYQSVFALYGTATITHNTMFGNFTNVETKFVCTVTAYEKVENGYLLLGAGHCTAKNSELPPDMTYSVSEEIGGMRTDVKLLKAEFINDKGLDYAVYYLKTSKKYPVVPLGDEKQSKIGDATIDVNFSLGLAKEYSPGIIVSTVMLDTKTCPDCEGYFEVQQFDSHGASGSAVIDVHQKKIIGIVVAGVDGATVPTIVEPISSVEKELAKTNIDYLITCSCTLPAQPAQRVYKSVFSTVTITPVTITPFRLIDGQYFVDTNVDGHKRAALLDTGSSITLIRANLIHKSATGSINVTDYHGGSQKIPTVETTVCVQNICNDETVGMVSTLPEDVVLRGSFLNQFSTATFDFKNSVLILIQ